MADFSADLSLLLFGAINIAVFASAWFFASRCVTRSRSQAILDAALLGYAVQYAAVGLPGLTHHLRPINIAAVAMVCVIVFLAAGWKTKRVVYPNIKKIDRMMVAGVALFAIGFLAMFVHSQASLPVISNDAMTYHFPAAVQWLQQGRISLFQTWFFNPANTYSPLSGSMFIVWMIAPFGSDVLARFVEVPALLCMGIAMYRLCREVGARVAVAALVAGAAVFARPIFTPSMMGKDDLFVAFFFIATLVAMSPDRSSEREGAARFGIALGLLLATKYTAMLAIPILLLAIDGPRWRIRGWITASIVAMFLAGPWYLRNQMLTKNPLFPLDSLFSTSHSAVFHSWKSSIAVLVGSAYALPFLLAFVLGVGWLAAVPSAWRRPIPRACTLGIILGVAVFFLKSPFPEVRFVLPVFLLLFACSAIAIQRLFAEEVGAIAIGLMVFAASLGTVFAWAAFSTILSFSADAIVLTLIGLIAIRYAKASRFRWMAIIAILAGLFCQYGYVHWTAYCRDYRESLFDDESGYDVEYPQLNRLWRFAYKNIPADTTIAYTNMYLIYPLENYSAERKLIYAPTRPEVKSIADLGWLGSTLSGEQLVPAAVRATIQSPDRAAWLQNLKASGAKYLIIGKGGSIKDPPEAAFAAADPAHFHFVYDGPAGLIYQVR